MAHASGEGRFLRSLSKASFLILFAGYLFLRIPVSRILDDSGMGYFSGILEVFLLCLIIFGIGLYDAILFYMPPRLKREQYRNASILWRSVYRVGIILALVIFTILMLFSGPIAGLLIGKREFRFMIYVLAICVLLLVQNCLYRGYLNALSKHLVVLLSILVEMIAVFICSIVFGKMSIFYGKKISVLLSNEQITYLYGAFGALCGILISQFIVFLFLLFNYILCNSSYKRIMQSDNGYKNESFVQLIPTIVEHILLWVVRTACFQLPIILLRIFYLHFMKESGEFDRAFSLWGSFYAKYLFVTGLLSILCLAHSTKRIKSVSAAFGREEYGLMKDRFGRAIGTILFLGLPSAIFSALLAGPILNALFTGLTDSATTCLAGGSAVIVLYLLAYFMHQTYIKIQMYAEAFIMSIAGFGIGTLIAYIMIVKRGMGLIACSISLCLIYGIMSVIGLVLMILKLQVRINYKKTIIYPLLISCISGIVVLVLKALLIRFAGNWITFLVSTVLGCIVYMILAMLTDLVTEAQLEHIPVFGTFFILLGRTLNILT